MKASDENIIKAFQIPSKNLGTTEKFSLKMKCVEPAKEIEISKLTSEY